MGVLLLSFCLPFFLFGQPTEPPATRDTLNVGLAAADVLRRRQQATIHCMNTKCFPIFTRENFGWLKFKAVRIFALLFFPYLSVTVITAITVQAVITDLAVMAAFAEEEIEDESVKEKTLNEVKTWIIKSSGSNEAMHFGFCDDFQALIGFKANVMLRATFKEFKLVFCLLLNKWYSAGVKARLITYTTSWYS